MLVGGDRVGVPITLAVGNVTESIEVSAQAPLLQTESTTLGADLNTKTVAQTAARRPAGLHLSGAPVARRCRQPSPAPATQVGGGFSANGVRSNGQNNFLLNGVDNNVNVIDFLNQTAFVVGPSVEAIGEMRILTNGYNAEYGRGAGGVVNVNLKSGTNELHGVLFDILQNDKLNANRWEYNKAAAANGAFTARTVQAEPVWRWQLGGPIIKNRCSSSAITRERASGQFGGAIQNLGYGGFYTIPTQAMINGDFSKLLGGSVGTDAERAQRS